MPVDQNKFGVYNKRRVQIVRPAADGDVGYDPRTSGQVIIRYADEEPESPNQTPQFLVNRFDVEKQE